MHQMQKFLKKQRRHPYFGGYSRFIAVFILGTGLLLGVSIALAAEAAISQVPVRRFPVAQIFTFLFLMLGPFKIIGPFSKITKGADAGFIRKIAVLSIAFSCLALFLAAILGESILSNFGIPLPVLALSGGIILFLVALQNILQQFAPPTSHSEVPAGLPPTPSLNMALTPLAFPTIVTPYGIAALVMFIAYSPDMEGRLTIGAVVLAIMLLNLIVMITSRHILPVLGVLLPILSAVLGVVQVALGLQIINGSLKALAAL